MADLKESLESERILTPSEYSVPTFDAFNLDCLLAIFRHLPLLDLLRLRPQCRSLNDAVCEFLRSSCHKLELHLDADRNEADLKRVIVEYNSIRRYCNRDVNIPNAIRSITFSDTVRLHSHLFKNQPHFRCENLTQVKSAEGLTGRKVDSLVHFLTTYLSNLRELALFISHGDYFWEVSRILKPLRKLKVLLIDANSSIRVGSNLHSRSAASIVDAISGIPELESLYYFRNALMRFEIWQAPEPGSFSPHRLSSGEHFLEVLLPRLRVLHCPFYLFPVGMTFDKLEELGIDHRIGKSVTKNYFPGVKTLIIDYINNLRSQLQDDRLSFVNVKILRLDSCDGRSQRCFYIESGHMTTLNDLPNLGELHCCSVDYEVVDYEVAERNNTVVRLYSRIHPKCQHSFQRPENCVEPERMAEYANICKKYLRRLKLFRNEHPLLVHQF